MALTLNFNVGRLFSKGEKWTTAKLNALVKSISVTLSGSVGSADMGAGAVTPPAFAPGAYSYAAATLSGGTYGATFTPAVGGYSDGLWLAFKADATNTGAVNFDAGAGAKPIRKFAGQALEAGDIKTGQVVTVRYNTTIVGGGCWELSSLPAVALPEDWHYGIGSYAAGVYAITVVPTIASYTAGVRVWFKADTTNTGAVDININGLGAKNLFTTAGTELVANDIVAGQIVQAVYDGTNFQMVGGARASFVSAEQAVSQNSVTVAVAHGLPAIPTRVRWVLRCKTAELGYAIGDEVDANQAIDTGTSGQHIMQGANATNVFLVVRSTGANSIRLFNYGTQVDATITAADWKFVCYAWL